jgi:hypothetical protein
MDEKILVQTIYKKVSKSTYNKRLSSDIEKLLHPFFVYPSSVYVSIYNSIGVGSRLSCVACIINPLVIS